MRNIVPVAAIISAGKSHFLNVLYNIDFLECKAGIGTKFVNILRYNPEIKEPRFFHLLLKKVGERYIFYKDNSENEVIGKQNIIEANKKINEKFAQENHVDYEKIFYMTEINESPFITNKEYLLNYDLCDIPGLSEYQEVENPDENLKEDNLHEQDKTTEDEIYYNVELEKKSYINEIFSIIKDYIDGGIIIISVEKYHLKQNYEMIAMLKKVIKKEIKNFLIILNKIDLCQKPEEIIEDCKGFISKYFPCFKTFNINSNTFIPLSTNQLKNELLMKNDFKYLLNYHFQNYYSKIQRESNNGISTFIDHLRYIIKKMIKGITKEDIKKKIKESKIMNDEDIIKILNEIKNNHKGEKIKFGIKDLDFDEDFDDEGENAADNFSDFIDGLNPSYIVKLIYIFQKENKLIPPLSIEHEELLNYFNNNPKKPPVNVMIKFSNNINKSHETINTINKEILGELKKLKEKLENSDFIGSIMKDLYLTIEYLKTYDVIFIPFLGPSNSGKSTIINDIIGEEILQYREKECTKRGIIIRYKDDDEPDFSLKKADLICNKFLGEQKYFFEAKGRIIADGLEQVKGTIKGLNHDFPEKEENSFYYIKTKIKLFDDLGFDDSLKKMIYLIDFPGYGTGNIFERVLYKKVMSICNAFVFVVRNSVIKEKMNKKLLDELFTQTMRNKQKLPSGFIKSCCFVFNNGREQPITKNDLDLAKKDIKSIIKRIPDEDINACFFNAKYFQIYQYYFNYFFNIKRTIKQVYIEFIIWYQNVYKVPEIDNKNKSINFGEYLKYILDSTTNDLELENTQKKKVDENLEKEVNEAIESVAPNKVNEKQKSLISKYFNYARENINNMPVLRESNIEEFKKTFLDQIIHINEEMQIELFDKINKIIATLDYFFNSNFSERQKDSKTVKIFEVKIKETKDKLENLKTNSKKDIASIKKNYVKDIKKILKEKISKIETALEKKEWELYQKEIKDELTSKTEKLGEKISNILNNIDTDSNYVCSEAKDSFEKITDGEMKLDDIEKFKLFFSKNTSNKDVNIAEEIIKEVKICTENGFSKIWEKKNIFKFISSIFSRVSYLTNILEIIKEFYDIEIENIVNLMEQIFEKYINSIIQLIDSRYEIVMIKLTKSQKKEWEQLCQFYNKSKYKIQENRDKMKKIKNL